jgi:3-oxoadipate enol-lactonase
MGHDVMAPMTLPVGKLTSESTPFCTPDCFAVARAGTAPRVASTRVEWGTAAAGTRSRTPPPDVRTWAPERRGKRSMRVQPIDMLELLVREGIPEARPGPDGGLRPPVPLGRRVELPGRGTTFVREVAGPAGAPTLLLLHGLMASGGLNWFRAFETLGTEFRVLAPDLRGHARGVRSGQMFRLADCADDVAALLDELATGPVLVAGYSMGGPVAQLLCRRHPERVAGLVLCATAPRLSLGPLGAWPVDAAIGVGTTGARLGGRSTHLPSTPLRALRSRRASRPQGATRPRDLLQWTIAEFRRHDVRHLREAARAVSRFDSRSWLPEVDAPTAVVVTTRDHMVAPHQQLEAARLIEGASVHEIDGGHTICASGHFVEPFRGACRDVAARAART